MNTTRVEFWSLPWHALQRSLANEFVTPAAAGTVRPLPAKASTGMSWLARARSAAPPVTTSRQA